MEVIAIAHEGHLGGSQQIGLGFYPPGLTRISENLHSFGTLTSVFGGDSFLFGLRAQASSHSAPISTPLNAAEVTTFSHSIVCRSPQRKDSKMDCSLENSQHCRPLILRLTS